MAGSWESLFIILKVVIVGAFINQIFKRKGMRLATTIQKTNAGSKDLGKCHSHRPANLIDNSPINLELNINSLQHWIIFIPFSLYQVLIHLEV